MDKGERECVSRKIKKLADEGYDDAKQRVAIAIKHCAPGKSKSKHAADLFAAVGTSADVPVAEDEAKFAVPALPTEHPASKNPDGTVTVKDVPIFGENERSSFMTECKYDAAWLKGAHEQDGRLAKHGYRAPMHFGHHTFSGHPVERAGYFEISKVAKHKHLGKKLHVMFANLHFKDEPTYEKYAKDHPYRSVEISHERPDQINSLALLSSEAPYFQFPMAANKFGADLALATEPVKAHYFAWGDQAFADAPPAKGKKPFPPKKPAAEDGAEDDGQDGAPPHAQPGQPAAPPQEPGTNENDVVVAMLHGIMGLLNKLVDSNLKQIGLEDHVEPDGDEHESDEESDHDGETDEHPDGAKKMSDGNKNKPVVAASADTATMEGKIAALEAEVTRLRKEREAEQTFATLKADLAPYGISNLDAELRKRVADGTATFWAEGIKQIAPPAKRNETPTQPMEDPVVAKFIQDNPEEDPAEVRRHAETYAAAAGHKLAGIRAIRNVPLDRYLAVQCQMSKRG